MTTKLKGSEFVQIATKRTGATDAVFTSSLIHRREQRRDRRAGRAI